MLRCYGVCGTPYKYDQSVGLDPFIRLKFEELGYKIKFKQIIAQQNDPINSTAPLTTRDITDFEPSENDTNQNSIETQTLINATQRNLVFIVGNITPHFAYNVNRSINNEKINHFERKMSDIEFQFEPGHFILLKTILTELCKRFGYEDKKEMVQACYDF